MYTNDTSLEQVKALMQGMSPLMDETLSAADLNAAISEVDTNKTANGYYYGLEDVFLCKECAKKRGLE